MQPIIFFSKQLNINPIAFSIGSFKIYWYSLFILVGFLLGYFLVKHRLEKNKGKEYSFGIKFEDVFDYVLVAIFVGIISARVYYVLFNIGYYMRHPSEVLKVWHGGIAIYGAVIGVAIYACFFCRKRKISFFDFADLLVPYLALAQSIGRWGNFVNQEAYGMETNLPWKMGIYNEAIGRYMFVHPTFLYESICTMLIFITLMFVSRRRNFKGQIFYIYLIMYGAFRAMIEGLRTDSLMFANFRVSQILSVVFVIIFGITYYFASKRRAKVDK